MKKQIGIWVDLRNAYVVNAQPAPNAPQVIHLVSGIDESAASGGSRDKAPWGPQGGDPKRAAQEKRRQEEQHYFEKIIKSIPEDADELVIFGPAKAKFGLKHAMEDIKHFPPVLKGVETAAKMSQGQMEAWVLRYFSAS